MFRISGIARVLNTKITPCWGGLWQYFGNFFGSVQNVYDRIWANQSVCESVCLGAGISKPKFDLRSDCSEWFFEKKSANKLNDKSNTVFSSFDGWNLCILEAEIDFFFIRNPRSKYQSLEKLEQAKTLKNLWFLMFLHILTFLSSDTLTLDS